MSWAIGEEEFVDVFRVTRGNVFDFLEKSLAKIKHHAPQIPIRELTVSSEVLDAYMLACRDDRKCVDVVELDAGFRAYSYRNIVLTRGRQTDYSVGVNTHVGH